MSLMVLVLIATLVLVSWHQTRIGADRYLSVISNLLSLGRLGAAVLAR